MKCASSDGSVPRSLSHIHEASVKPRLVAAVVCSALSSDQRLFGDAVSGPQLVSLQPSCSSDAASSGTIADHGCSATCGSDDSSRSQPAAAASSSSTTPGRS